MTETGRRELIAAKLHSADRKLSEAARNLNLVGDLALGMARQALADMDMPAFQSAIAAVYRNARGYWAKATIRDATEDLREAIMIAREPVTRSLP